MLTDLEKEILKTTDKKYKYIARDYIGDLYIYQHKPIKYMFFWHRNFQSMGLVTLLKTFNHLFQDVKWKDDEPLRFRNNKGEFIL